MTRLRLRLLLPTLALLVSSLLLTVQGQTVKQLIQQGDAEARRYNEEKALEHYLTALKRDPQNVYLHIAISREYRHLLSDARTADEKRRHGQAALRHAERAASLAPNNAEAQLAPAITYGKLVNHIDGNKEQLEASKKLKFYADKAIALDPKNDLAWHILGRWHRGVAEVSGVKRVIGSLVYGDMPTSTYENACECFQRALSLKPDRLMHHVELGRTYARMGKEAEARKLITRGMAMRETEKDDPVTKDGGRQTLRELR